MIYIFIYAKVHMHCMRHVLKQMKLVISLYS